MNIPMKYILSIITLIVLLSVIHCNEDAPDQAGDESIQTSVIVISWNGDFAADGCGFFIFLEQVRFKADNEEKIGDEFKTDNLMRAVIKYAYIGKQNVYLCGDSVYPEEIDIIHIHSIQKIE